MNAKEIKERIDKLKPGEAGQMWDIFFNALESGVRIVGPDVNQENCTETTVIKDSVKLPLSWLKSISPALLKGIAKCKGHGYKSKGDFICVNSELTDQNIEDLYVTGCLDELTEESMPGTLWQFKWDKVKTITTQERRKKEILILGAPIRLISVPRSKWVIKSIGAVKNGGLKDAVIWGETIAWDSSNREITVFDGFRKMSLKVGNPASWSSVERNGLYIQKFYKIVKGNEGYELVKALV